MLRFRSFQRPDGSSVLRFRSFQSPDARRDDAFPPVSSPTADGSSLSGLDRPLRQLLVETARAVIDELGLEKPEGVVEGLGARWHKGKAVLHPADPTLQTKDIPLEVFFHKIVMVRNNLRVLEQKINSHKGLSDEDKIQLQHYITGCYGSLTTFNVLFKDKADQFSGQKK